MKKFKYITVLSLLLIFTSCDKWLDVSPVSNIKGDDLFKTEEGFHKALIGVYMDMVKSSCYGSDLTLSVVDVLAQNYSTPLEQVKHPYEKIAKYDYTNMKVESRIDGIWYSAYNCITGCNSIFESLDLKKDIFSEHYYEVVKGELLGIRAMLHFDMLRLFASSASHGLDNKAIPYVQYFGQKKAPFSTTKQVLEYIIRDLKNAQTLLKENDPIIAEYTPSAKVAPYLVSRQSRMNYYAVTALLARVYMWGGNDQMAYKYASEVYNSQKFSFVTDKNLEVIIEQEKTLTFRDEHIMGLYVDQLQNNVTKYLYDKTDVSTILAVNENEVNNLYSAADLRFNTWYKEVGNGYYTLVKFKKENYIPLIRLSEMLLIMAEAAPTLTEVGEHLNTLKDKRGIPHVLVTQFVLNDLLLEEYRREFIGEGVMFYQYKRLGLDKLPNNVLVKDAKQVYNLPIPKKELEFM